MKLRRRWILLLTLSLLLSPGLFLCLEHFRGGWRLADTREALVAKGEKLTILGNVPPSGEGPNQFRNALWIINRLPHEATTEPTPPAMLSVLPGRAMVGSREPFWIGQDPKKHLLVTNTWEDFKSRVDPDHASWNQLAEVLRAPHLDSRLDYSQSFALRLPHLARVKQSAHRLQSKVLWELNAGRHSEALEATQASVRLDRLLESEPLLISHLVRAAIAALALPTTWECLQAEGWSDDPLRQLQEAWEEQPWLGGISEALRMERAMFLDLAAQAHTDPAMVQQAIGSYSDMGWMDQNSTAYLLINELPFGKGMTDALQAIPWRIWLFTWFDQDVAHYSEVLQAGIDASLEARENTSYLTMQQVLDQIESRRAHLGTYDRWRYQFSVQTLPSLLGRFPQRMFAAEARRQLAVTAIALHRYKLRHQTFPSRLADLTPDFLSSVPIDPMDGKPLRYRLNEDGSFLLYSVGENSLDDEGNAETNNPLRPTFSMGKDWVWPVAASRTEIDAYHERVREE